MKITAVFAFVVILMCSPCVSQTDAQRADFLFQQSTEAMGGAEAIAKVTNLSARASCTETDIPLFIMEVQPILPDRTLFRQRLQTRVNETSVVGDVVWRRPPSAGAAKVEITLESWTPVGEVLFPLFLTLKDGQEVFSFHNDYIELGVVKSKIIQIPPETRMV